MLCVTHNSAGLLPSFATATSAALASTDGRLVVIDSGSPDDTVAACRNLLPEADVCVLAGNRGFAAAVNAGVAHVQRTGGARTFVIVNPDVRLDPGCLPPLDAALQEPGVGIAAARLEDEDGGLQFSLRHVPRVRSTLADVLLGGPRAARRGLPTEVIRDEASYRHRTRAAWATGGCLAVSAACLARTGPWDESFWLYEEEVDFCLRAAEAGFSLQLVPGARAVREVGDRLVAPWVLALMRTNRVAHLRRRRGSPTAALVAVLLVLGDSVRALRGRPEARAGVWALVRRRGPSQIMARYRPDAAPVVGRPGDAPSMADWTYLAGHPPAG